MGEYYQILKLFGMKCKPPEEVITDLLDAMLKLRPNILEPKKSQVRMLGLKND